VRRRAAPAATMIPAKKKSGKRAPHSPRPRPARQPTSPANVAGSGSGSGSGSL